jgi:CDP-6-deoxy-D-xylo-4-hexulose-3-dehydrase
MQRFEHLFYPHEHDDRNSSFCFPFVCRTPEIMQTLKEVLKAYGVEYRPIVGGNLLGQPFLREYKLDSPKNRPNADIIEKQGVYIGNNHFLTQKDIIMLWAIMGDLNDKCSRIN